MGGEGGAGGNFALFQRPAGGLLGGLWEFPSVAVTVRWIESQSKGGWRREGERETNRERDKEREREREREIFCRTSSRSTLER